MWNPLQVSHYIPCLLHCAHFVSNCLTVWSPHLKCILQRLLYSYIVALFMVKVGEKKHLQFVMTLSCHRSNVFSPPPPHSYICTHTLIHTHPRPCVRFWGWANMWFLTRPEWCLWLDEAESPDTESQAISQYRPWDWPQWHQGGWGIWGIISRTGFFHCSNQCSNKSVLEHIRKQK